MSAVCTFDEWWKGVGCATAAVLRAPWADVEKICRGVWAAGAESVRAGGISEARTRAAEGEPGLTQAQFDDLFHRIVTSQERADHRFLVEDLPGGLAAEVTAWSLFNQLEAVIQRLPEDRRTVNAAARLSEARMWLEQLECDEWPDSAAGIS